MAIIILLSIILVCIIIYSTRRIIEIKSTNNRLEVYKKALKYYEENYLDDYTKHGLCYFFYSYLKVILVNNSFPEIFEATKFIKPTNIFVVGIENHWYPPGNKGGNHYRIALLKKAIEITETKLQILKK